MKKIRIMMTVLSVIAGMGCAREKAMDEAVPSASAEVTPESVQETSQETVKDSVYETGRQQMVCIFTDSGNNGTGFVYQQKFVITNEHVLYEASGFVMRDYEGREYQGTVFFSDSDDDIAVIRAEDMDLTSATFGDSDAVSAGDELICIGNPAGGEPFSTVSGTVLNLDDELRQKADRRHRFIASDAPVISGYSGGPVFNVKGEVIGLSSAAYVEDLSAYDFDYLSLIIPVNRVREKIEAAIKQ